MTSVLFCIEVQDACLEFRYNTRLDVSTQLMPSSYVVQAQSLTVTPLTVTVGYSDTLEDSQTITNDFEVVTVTNMLLQ